MTQGSLFRLIFALALFLGACSTDEPGVATGDEVAPDDPVTEQVSSEANDRDLAEPTEEVVSSDAELVEAAEDEDELTIDEVDESAVVRTAVETAAALGPGINIGNVLDAPREGDWGVSLEAEDFVTIAEAGFDHVRLPVSWAGYADTAAPFTIPDGDDPTIQHPDYSNIWERVDWAIEQAEANDLLLIINMHHYDEAHANPEGHRDRIVGMWEQIAARYADASDDVIFELFNEPHGVYTEQPELWNELAADLLAVVRATNPTRKVLVGPVDYNHIADLDTLVLPDDPNLIATVHLYEPFEFTHQGADWTDPPRPVGVEWADDQVSLADGFRDLAWDITTSDEGGALRIDYSRQWAGFGVGWNGTRQPGEVRIVANSDAVTVVQVGCQVIGNQHVEVERITLTPEPTEFTVDLSGCGADSIGVGLLNANAELVAVRVSELVACTEEVGCEQLLSTADEWLRGWLRDAAAWSDAQGVPIHLGEFGAFGADGESSLADRAAWTATLANEATALDIAYSYWEFNSGFGAFDEQNGEWIPELKAALLNQ